MRSEECLSADEGGDHGRGGVLWVVNGRLPGRCDKGVCL